MCAYNKMWSCCVNDLGMGKGVCVKEVCVRVCVCECVCVRESVCA